MTPPRRTAARLASAGLAAHRRGSHRRAAQPRGARRRAAHRRAAHRLAGAAITVWVTCGLCAACGSVPTVGPAAHGRMRVVATTTQGGDFARVIGGDRVDVVQLLRPGVDPHDYEPGPADLVALYAAKVLVSNGAGLESWLDATISAAGFRGERVVMAQGVTLRHQDGSSGPPDPHIWHNPRNAEVMVADVARGLSQADPAGAAYYRANLDGYTAQLRRLDATTTAEIATIPPADRKLVTNHDAFGYYAARYGLAVVGSIVPSFDTSAELSGRDVSTIVSTIKKEHVPAIFSESSVPPKIAQTIGEQAGVTVISGEGSLYADTLGPAGSVGATYLNAETHNTDVIVGALRGARQ